MKKVVLVSALLLLMGSAQAVESPKWDQASVSFLSIDTPGIDAKGFAVSGSKLLNNDFFATGNYERASGDVDVYGSSVDIDFNTLSVGVGYRHSLAVDTDMFGVVSYNHIEADASYQGFSESESDNGFGLAIGLRSMVTDEIELNGSINYVDYSEAQTTFALSALYNFTEQCAAGVGYSRNSEDDINTFSLSAVYYF